jgi:hypothetical protein
MPARTGGGYRNDQITRPGNRSRNAIGDITAGSQP